MLTRPAVVAAEPTEVEHRFDLREILNFVWRQWVFIATVFGVVVVIGAVSLLREIPRYTASAQILLEPQKERVTNDSILSDLILNPNTVESQMQIIRSTVLLRPRRRDREAGRRSGVRHRGGAACAAARRR